MNRPALSIIIPCYNPIGYWKENLLKHTEAIRQQIPNLEVLIVNDGSTNISTEEIKAFFTAYNYIKVSAHNTNRGKGHTLRNGVLLASGDLIIYTDIDFPYTEHSFDKILAALQQGSDIAMGVRSATYYTHLPKARIYISKFLRLLIRTTLRIPTDDTQCGLKGFNQRGREVFLHTTINRYLFDLEFIFLAARQKLNIKTVEVELREGIQLSTMRVGVLLQEGGNFLSVLWRSLFS